MKLLHLDSSITGEDSVTRRLSARIVENLRQAYPGISIHYRDLASQPLPHHRLAHGNDEDRGGAEAVLAEFLDADVVVIGAPMYNFAIPSQLKAWVDSILVAGKTFRYTQGGVPEGLARGKRVIVASSRGGVYSDGPYASLDHQEKYLRTVFGFIGIADVEFVRAEGVAHGSDARRQAIDGALTHSDTIHRERVAA